MREQVLLMLALGLAMVGWAVVKESLRAGLKALALVMGTVVGLALVLVLALLWAVQTGRV